MYSIKDICKIDFTNLTVLENMTESELANIATFAFNDAFANAAMKILREKYDSTYDWDCDLDGVVNTHEERNGIYRTSVQSTNPISQRLLNNT